MTDASPLLDVRHLSVDYHSDNGTVHAVTDVSFTLHRGEILGIAGESGCGKSTLAYAITQLLGPLAEISAGEMLYYGAGRPHPVASREPCSPSAMERGRAASKADQREQRTQPALSDLPSPSADGEQGSREATGGLGVGPSALPSPSADGVGPLGVGPAPVDILRLSPRRLRALRWSELAIVFQSAMNALNPVMTIGTQIMDVLRAHRPAMTRAQRQDRAAELLRLVGIAPERLKSYPHELSGGMRQRAAIAIALALLPPIIIMDEPTTALDVVVQREILNEIVQLRDQLHFALIFITHDLSLLLELADTIAIMYAGRIVEQGAQRDLYRHPRHPYSYGLLNAFPTLTGEQHAMYGIPGTPPDLRQPPAGCAFHDRCPLAFSACTAKLPVLQPWPVATTQTVACHLYNPRLHATPPTTAEIAASYAALAEGRTSR